MSQVSFFPFVIEDHTFCSIQVLNWLADAYPIAEDREVGRREAICFTQSADLNITLIQKYLHRHTQNNV